MKIKLAVHVASILIVLASLITQCISVHGQSNDHMYSTFIGGSDVDRIHDVTKDSRGNIIVVGGTFSDDFPLKNAHQGSYGGGVLVEGEHMQNMGDATVMKFSSSYELLWSTYLGGVDLDCAKNVEVDSHDNIIVVGDTVSTDFPVSDGSSIISEDGSSFITRYTPDGDMIDSRIYSPNEVNMIVNIEKDPDGNLVLVGQTSSQDYYCTDNAFQQELGGESDGFIRVVTEDLETILFSTYLGGSQRESINELSVDADGSLYVAGFTYSYDFPVTEDCIRPEYLGEERDCFIAKVGPSRNYAMGTYFGGSDVDDIFGLTYDPFSDTIIVVGRTWSSDFPATSQALQPQYSDVEVDGFLSQVSAAGDEILYSTFYGMNGWDSLLQVNADEMGRLLVSGFVDSGGFDTVNAFQSEYMGYTEIIVMVWGEEIELVSYLGGYSFEHPYSQYVTDGKLYLVGQTSSAQFPVTDDAYQGTLNGAQDGFLWVLDYDAYLSGEHASDSNGSDSLGPSLRLYLSYGVVIGAIALWYVYVKRSFTGGN